jgi:hypothetical protein
LRGCAGDRHARQQNRSWFHHPDSCYHFAARTSRSRRSKNRRSL